MFRFLAVQRGLQGESLIMTINIIKVISRELELEFVIWIKVGGYHLKTVDSEYFWMFITIQQWLTYKYILVRFSNDLNWPDHCTEMAICTAGNNQKTKKQGKLSKLLQRRLKVVLMITAFGYFGYFCKKQDIFSMWTQGNAMFHSKCAKEHNQQFFN